MTVTSRALLEGLAQHLSANSVGTWKPSGAYAASDWGIVLKVVPQDPDRVVIVTPYDTVDGVPLPVTQQFVQLRFRRGGLPTDVDEDADAAFELLHMSHHLTLPGGVAVDRIVRTSTAYLGQDDTGRYERTDNYQITHQ